MLEYRNRKVAVIEAKRWSLPISEGVQQAKDYAKIEKLSADAVAAVKKATAAK